MSIEDTNRQPGGDNQQYPYDGGLIQKLQKKVLLGQQLNAYETEYLAQHATKGVTGYLRRKFPRADIHVIILAYATEELKMENPTEKMITGICYEIQFDFERLKIWVEANKRRFR